MSAHPRHHPRAQRRADKGQVRVHPVRLVEIEDLEVYSDRLDEAAENDSAVRDLVSLHDSTVDADDYS